MPVSLGNQQKPAIPDVLLLQPRLNSPRQRPEIRDALQLVVRQLDVKMMFQPGQQVERLQTVDFQRLEKIVVRSESCPRHFEMGRGQIEDFIQRLIGGSHGFHHFQIYEPVETGVSFQFFDSSKWTPLASKNRE